MDTGHFLRERLTFIGFYCETAASAFRDVQRAIEQEAPPFDNPPYSEDGEPAFLPEWLNAKTGLEVLGLSCVSLMSDSLKLYLHTLQHRVIGFSFDLSETKALRRGFLAAHLAALDHILETDWRDCPADLDVIEQVVLARNRAAHGEDLTSFAVIHDRRTLEKHPRPFFADPEEWSWAGSEPESLAAMMQPKINVGPEHLTAAITEIERLVTWIEGRIDRAHEWRARARAARAAGRTDGGPPG